LELEEEGRRKKKNVFKKKKIYKKFKSLLGMGGVR